MKRIALLLVAWSFLGVLSAQMPTTYLVSDFSEEELDQMLVLCMKGGIKGLLHGAPFSSYGHYEWKPDFAPKGNRSVAGMVEHAQENGILLGIYAQKDAISLNDRYFTPRYFHRLKKSGRVALFDDIAADQREFAVYPNEVFDHVSTLNLLLADGEMISYGTMEHAQEAVLLYRCSRGAFGTEASDHDARAEVYKIWDAPGRFVAPDESLRDSVQWHLSQRIASARLPFVRYSGESGMNKVDGSVRVRQVERWERERDSLSVLGLPLELGWLSLRASEGRQSATTLEELEWMLSKAAAFDAGYGLVIDRAAVKRYGCLDKALSAVKAWNTVRDAGILTLQQKEDLKDPYTDWHLEAFGDDSFLLYPIRCSRGYRCVVKGAGRWQETWQWKSSSKSLLALRIEVNGKGEIRKPVLVVGEDTLELPCPVKSGQFLVCGFDGMARLTDADLHTIREWKMEALSALAEGETPVVFSFEARSDGKLPEVVVRYQTRETPIPLMVAPDLEWRPDGGAAPH